MQVYGNNEMMTGSLRPRLALARALQHQLQLQLGLQLQLTGGRLARHRSVLANGVAGVAAVVVAMCLSVVPTVPTAQWQYAIVHQRSLLRNHIKSGSVGGIEPRHRLSQRTGWLG